MPPTEVDRMKGPGAQYLEDNRSILIFLAIVGGVLGIVLVAFEARELMANGSAAGLVAAGALIVIWGASFAGALLFGRRRAARVTMREDFAPRAPAPWLSTLLAVLPGGVLVVAQVVRAEHAVAYEVVGLISAYGMFLLSGMATGVVLESRRMSSSS